MFSNHHQRIFWALVHAVSMIMLLIGLYLCWILPWWYTAGQLIGVAWMISRHLRFHECPLTRLELDAMARDDKPPYEGGFYQYYLFKKVFGLDVSDKAAKHFLIATKVVPGVIPVLYFFAK